jgi:hypothetical protein
MAVTTLGTLSDDELTEQALAAEATDVPGDDAVDFWTVVGPGVEPLVADWYMPAAAGRQLRGWRRRVVLAIVIAFLLIDAYGLCSTYGAVVPA